MSIARRQFLSRVAGAGGTSLASTLVGSAQTPPPGRKYSKPVIDAHFHWHPPEFLDLIEKEGPANGLWDIRHNPDGSVSARLPGYHPYTGGGLTFRPRDPGDVDDMLKKMDERHVDMCTITQTNPHVIWAPPAFGVKLAQTINDATSKLCAKYPKRFTAAITMPMQDVNAALVELERARKLPGMRAVNITENIRDKNLGDQEFWPVYAAVEKTGMPIFLHNVDPVWERLVEPDYSMINVLGNPFEATMAATSLVLSGAMDEFPKLDVYFPHAAGFFAFVTPRMDWTMGTAEYAPRGRTATFKNLKQPRASDYRRRFHYDLIMHDPKITRMLIDLVGVDRIVCGTDYPQMMGIMQPVEYVEQIPGITQKEAETILCDNPARLLRL